MSESPKRLACDPLWPGADRGADAAARRGEGRQVPLLFGALPHALLHRSRLVPGADGAQARTQGVAMMLLRHVRPSDCDRVLAVIDEWWGGPATSSHLPHVFFSHLAPTSFVLEANDGELVGFLLGFFSQARPDEACVHMVGVLPPVDRLPPRPGLRTPARRRRDRRPAGEAGPRRSGRPARHLPPRHRPRRAASADARGRQGLPAVARLQEEEVTAPAAGTGDGSVARPSPGEGHEQFLAARLTGEQDGQGWMRPGGRRRAGVSRIR